MNYRFENGGLGGHSFGNLLLSALEKVTGSFEKAVEEAGKILSIKGQVIPVTTNPVRLHMVLANDKVLRGEKEILVCPESLLNFKSIYLEPFPTVNSRAIDEMMNADLIIFGPGGLYTSLIPVLLVEGIGKALRESKAKKIFVVNLMNKKVQTPQFKASNYLKEVQRFIGKDVFDHIIVNKEEPAKELLEKYAAEAEYVVNDLGKDMRVIQTDLLDNSKPEISKSDVIAHTRALIRHDAPKLASAIMRIVDDL